MCSSGIDRTMPAVMSPYMSNYQWVGFCDKIDEAMAPINKLGKLTMIGFAVTFAVFALVMIITFTSVSTGFDDDDNFGSGGPNVFVFFALPAAAIVLTGGLSCYTGYKAQQVLLEIEDICKETSAAHPRLSFHVRYDYHYRRNHNNHHSSSTSTQYIEVSICQDTTAMSTAVAAEPVVAGVPLVESTTTNLSPAERLAELEKVRHILSQEEYDNKRAEILACM